MSKGRPGIVRPNYPPSPSFSPAIRPRSRSPPVLQALVQPLCTVIPFSTPGSPGLSFPSSPAANRPFPHHTRFHL